VLKYAQLLAAKLENRLKCFGSYGAHDGLFFASTKGFDNVFFSGLW
jgi:hypothetical protein